jgi:hypothetical protein
MAKVAADRVKETSTFEGLNDIALLGAGVGFVNFSDVCQDGDTFDYSITHEGTGDWETGLGTYVSSTNTVIRTEVIASSNSNQKVNFGEGYKQIFITINSKSFRSYSTKTIATGLAVALGG